MSDQHEAPQTPAQPAPPSPEQAAPTMQILATIFNPGDGKPHIATAGPMAALDLAQILIDLANQLLLRSRMEAMSAMAAAARAQAAAQQPPAAPPSSFAAKHKPKRKR